MWIYLPPKLSASAPGSKALGSACGSPGESWVFEPGTVCYVEREFAAAKILAGQMEQGLLDSAPVWSDVKTFARVAARLRGCVDILTGGYPCQPFSMAGKRGGREDPRHLWPDIFDIIRAAEPVCCFFENVAGHLTLGFAEVCHGLHEAGYEVEAGLYTAAETGASHLRQRLFILAHHQGEQCQRAECGGIGRRQSKAKAGNRGEPLERGDGGGDAGQGWRPQHPDAGRDVGDSNGAGLEGRHIGGDRAREWAAGEAGWELGLYPPGGDVGDAISGGLHRDAWRRTGQEPADGHFGLYPPGPDSPDWPAIIERRPWLAPALEYSAGKRLAGGDAPERSGASNGIRAAIAGSDTADGGGSEATQFGIRRVADEFSALLDAAGRHRTDRLRALGNAVVPVCAAVAFCDLARKLGLWEGTCTPID